MVVGMVTRKKKKIFLKSMEKKMTEEKEWKTCIYENTLPKVKIRKTLKKEKKKKKYKKKGGEYMYD